MPIINLKPASSNNDEATPREVNLADIEKRLQQAVPGLAARDEVRGLLNEHGGSLQEAVITITQIMHDSPNDNLRRLTARDVLELHGVINTKDPASSPINVVISDNVNIQNVLQGQG